MRFCEGPKGPCEENESSESEEDPFDDESEESESDTQTEPNTSKPTPSEIHETCGPMEAESTGTQKNPHKRTKEKGRAWLHRAFREAMCERFLRGEDKEFVDYDAIDRDETDGSIRIATQDDQDKYFDADDEETPSRGNGDGDVDDDDDYMKFDLSTLG